MAEALTTNSTLTTLNLGDNDIGDDGPKTMAEALATNSTLTTLHLGGNSIGDDGAKAMGEALATNSTLTTLDLQYSKIGAEGAKTMAEALATNSTLTTLHLGGNNIGRWGEELVMFGLLSNTTLRTLEIDPHMSMNGPAWEGIWRDNLRPTPLRGLNGDAWGVVFESASTSPLALRAVVSLVTMALEDRRTLKVSEKRQRGSDDVACSGTKRVRSNGAVLVATRDLI
jgi:hypothetical protein